MGEKVREAAIAGIRMWDGKPFSLIIDTRDLPHRPWDICVNNASWRYERKRLVS